MADEKNVTLEQFKGFMTKADERLDKLEVGKENKVSPVSITIPTEGWASEEIGETDEEGTEASYPFYYDIAAADVTAKHRADVTISRESLDAATVCGLCPTSETTEGRRSYCASLHAMEETLDLLLKNTALFAARD